jgi:hypothetical protein
VTAIEAPFPSLSELEVVVNMGFALCVSPSSRDRHVRASDPEGCAVGAPNVPERGRVPEGGACPHLLQAAR